MEDDEQYEESEEGEAEAFVCAWTTVAADDELEDEGWLEEDHPDLRCYTVQTVIDPEEFQNVEDQIAHDVLQSFVTAGADVDVPEHFNQICHCFHAEREAFFAREGARRSGARITPSIHNFRPRSELSFDDRKKMLAKAKSNSKCKRCGEKGHWQGDPECNKGKGGSKGNKSGGDGSRSFGTHQGHGLVARTAPTAGKKLSAEARVAVALPDTPKAMEYEMIDDDAFIRDVPPPFGEAPRASSWPASRHSPLAIRDILLRYEVPDTPELSRVRKLKRPASRKIETADGATPRAIEEPVPSISSAPLVSDWQSAIAGDGPKSSGHTVPAGDGPKFSGHTIPGDASKFSEHSRGGNDAAEKPRQRAKCHTRPEFDIEDPILAAGSQGDSPEDSSAPDGTQSTNVTCFAHNGADYTLSDDESGDWRREEGPEVAIDPPARRRQRSEEMEMEPPHAEQSAIAAASSHQALRPPPHSRRRSFHRRPQPLRPLNVTPIRRATRSSLA